MVKIIKKEEIMHLTKQVKVQIKNQMKKFKI